MRRFLNFGLAAILAGTTACAPKTYVLTTNKSVESNIVSSHLSYEDALMHGRSKLVDFCQDTDFEDALVASGSGRLIDVGSKARIEYNKGRVAKEGAQVAVRKVLEIAESEAYLTVMHCHNIDKDVYIGATPSSPDIKSSVILSLLFYKLQPRGQINFEVVSKGMGSEIYSVSYSLNSETLQKELQESAQWDKLADELINQNPRTKEESLERDSKLAALPLERQMEINEIAAQHIASYSSAIDEAIKINKQLINAWNKVRVGSYKHIVDKILKDASRMGSVMVEPKSYQK
jgi:hypothetical protein